MKQKRDSNKSSPKKKSKSRKTKQKDASTSGKSRNKLTHLEQDIRQILLDMLEKVLLPHQLKKLRSEDKCLTISDFINHREPTPEIPDSDREKETLDDPIERKNR